ncbi:MAG: helix-turn-helix transcriptional regulator [Cyanobacteria bacterium P01_G01_bin.19]
MIQNTLDALLSQRDLTVPKLSKISDIKEVTLYNLVNNPNVVPTATILDKLCQVFEVTVGTLIVHIALTDQDEDGFATLSPERQEYSYKCFRAYWIWKKHREFEYIKPLDKYRVPIIHKYIGNFANGDFYIADPSLKYFQNVDDGALACVNFTQRALNDFK